MRVHSIDFHFVLVEIVDPPFKKRRKFGAILGFYGEVAKFSILFNLDEDIL